MHANLLAGDLHVILNDLRRQRCLVQVLAVQYPDPHWKGKHKKRRVLTQSLLRTVAAHLGAGGAFYLQSDVQEVVLDVATMLAPPPSSAVTSSLAASAAKSTRSEEEEEDFTLLRDLAMYSDSLQTHTKPLVTGRVTDDLHVMFNAQACVSPSSPQGKSAGDIISSGSSSSSRNSSTALLRRYLPSCFFDSETERASYVRRLHKPTHHLLCTATAQAFLKSCSMRQLLEGNEQQREEQKQEQDQVAAETAAAGG
jgi:hypothetical protein